MYVKNLDQNSKEHIFFLTNYPQHFPLDPLNTIITNHTWYINFLVPRTAVMRPMLDIPRTLSSQLCKQHCYSSSSIFTHYFIGHRMSPPPATTLIENFKIIYASPELINLKIAEAITIKTTKPIINVKYNELYDFLKLFLLPLFLQFFVPLSSWFSLSHLPVFD